MGPVAIDLRKPIGYMIDLETGTRVPIRFGKCWHGILK